MFPSHTQQEEHITTRPRKVDPLTWTAALVVVIPFVFISTMVPPMVITIVQLVWAMFFLLVLTWTLYDLTEVEAALSPQLWHDASVFIEKMQEGYDATLKSKSGGRKQMTVSAGNSGPGMGDMTDEMKQQLAGKKPNAHPSLWSPIHVRKMVKMHHRDKALAGAHKKREEKARLKGVPPDTLQLDLPDKKRKWIVTFLGGDPNYTPHEHDECFAAEEFGIKVYHQIMRTV